MAVQVGFLRAVNLGKRRVSMARLKGVGEELGFSDVWTHVNSGNVVFNTSGTRATIEKTMEKALEQEFGFECTTFVRSAKELDEALAVQPFALAPSDTYFITFLKRAPSASQRKALEALSNDFDTLEVHGPDVHWLMHGRSSDSSLVRRDWEKVLGPLSSTSRNVNMLTKLAAKIGSRSA
jgi:uncharacterized protein (DUF1697 family)